MTAKLIIRDTEGNIVFDSSTQLAMSLIHKQRWSYVITPVGRSASIRVTHPRINANTTFAYLIYVSASANLMNYSSDSIVSIKYYDGYLDIVLPNESTYSANLTMTYDIKVYNR